MPGFVWGFAHTQSGEGKRREGGREQGQPATTTKGETRGKQPMQTSRQNKGRKSEDGGRRKHTGAQPWHPEEQTAQSRTGNWSRTAKGMDKHTPVGAAKEEEGKRTGRRREGVLCIQYPWAHRGKRATVQPAIRKYHKVSRSHAETGEGGCAKLPIVIDLVFVLDSQPCGLLQSCEIFLSCDFLHCFVIRTCRPWANSHGHQVPPWFRSIAVPHSAPEGRLRFNASHRAYKRHSQVSETVPVHMAESKYLLWTGSFNIIVAKFIYHVRKRLMVKPPRKHR